MPGIDIEYDTAFTRCHAAIIEFQAAASVIDTRMLTGSPPTPAELCREEETLRKLTVARRRLYSTSWVPPSVGVSARS
jgi:hypothetical protein